MKHQQFLVVIEKGPKNYSAYSPDLPGCITTGKTREETERNMHEAIQLHIDGMTADGDKIPKSGASAVSILAELPTKAEAKKRLEKDKVKPNSWPRLSARPHTSR